MELTKTDTVWMADSQDERLRLAFVDFKRECQRHGVSALFAPVSQ